MSAVPAVNVLQFSAMFATALPNLREDVAKVESALSYAAAAICRARNGGGDIIHPDDWTTVDAAFNGGLSALLGVTHPAAPAGVPG